jgi:hypothetical protein
MGRQKGVIIEIYMKIMRLIKKLYAAKKEHKNFARYLFGCC